MKKLLLPILATLVTTSSYAMQAITLSEDVVSVANLMKSKSVQKCISELEQSKTAEFSISDVTRAEFNNEVIYQLNGTMLVGGDVAVGRASIDVKSSTQPFLGRVYECKVVSE